MQVHNVLSCSSEFEAEPYPLIETPTDCEPSLSGRIEPISPIIENDDRTTEQVSFPSF